MGEYVEKMGSRAKVWPECQAFANKLSGESLPPIFHWSPSAVERGERIGHSNFAINTFELPILTSSVGQSFGVIAFFTFPIIMSFGKVEKLTK